MKMSFQPSCHLEKYGWKTGSGIGKGEDGIKEAIKVKLKFDTTGVGHNVSEQFTHHWWEKAYNDASQNVEVREDQNGIQMKTTGSSVVSTKKSAKSLAGKNLLYGTFVKAANLTDGIEERVGDSSSSSDSDSDTSDSQTRKNSLVDSVISDEDLFRICGGRTAHKGARHGLKANGKLARIAMQDAGHGGRNAESLRVIGQVGTDKTVKGEIREKRRKKEKKSKTTDSDEQINEEIQSETETSINNGLLVQEEAIDVADKLDKETDTSDIQVIKRKSKKKRKRERIENGDGSENVQKDANIEADDAEIVSKKHKKNKKKKRNA